PGTFDFIIVDEAHRGYTLDAELRETDIGFRNLDDYQSAYLQILDYFDAVKVALTATPALHTREIFGHRFSSYRQRRGDELGRHLIIEVTFNDGLAVAVVENRMAE
ncbi:DEAD/DEAH box helicase family protein, partial [Rhizobium ruizarguesonis]